MSQTPVSTPREVSEKSSKSKTPAVYKTLLNLFSDPENPVMKALVSSLVTPITDIIQREFAAQSKRISDLVSRVETLETNLDEKDKKIEYLSDEIDELQQYGRRNAVVISGVPEREGENTDTIMLEIARDKMNISLEPHEIGRSHRLGPVRVGARKPRNIVVKLVTYNVRKRIYDARKSLAGGPHGIFISEHLTKRRGELFYQARQLLKKGKVKYAWTSDGRVLVRDYSGKASQIRSLSDINNIN